MMIASGYMVFQKIFSSQTIKVEGSDTVMSGKEGEDGHMIDMNLVNQHFTKK